MVAPSRSSPIRQCIFPNGAGSIVKHILGRPTAMFKRKPCRMFEFIGSSNLSLVQMKPNEPSLTPATAIGVSSSILDLISIMTWRNESWRWICPSLCFKIDRKKLLFITWFPWASLRNFTTLFAWFTCKRWRPASDRIQRLRQTLGGSSWCPPRQLRSCRTSLLKKASEQKTRTLPISVHLCQEISTSSLHEFASQVAWARCTGPKRGSEMKPDMAPFPSISGAVSQMVKWPKKSWNAECHKEKEIVDTNLSTRQMPQDTCCRAIVCACSSISHLSNMQTRNHRISKQDLHAANCWECSAW